MSDFHSFYLAFARLVGFCPEAIWHESEGKAIDNLTELDDPRIGSDEWMERFDTLARDAWGLSVDILQESLEREFSVNPDIARQMALVELEQVTEDELAQLREAIASGLAPTAPFTK